MKPPRLREADFTELLLKWHRHINKRQMPWKGEKDPYKIWLSEIILQQTRVEQGEAYYNKFIREFPTISDLAHAEPGRVMKMWEGLGYYSRCRNMHATAKIVMENFNGRFPDNFADIRSLKGIGDYTAAAIASFGFDLPYAVVDGNVYRVLSRVFGIETPVDTTTGKKEFAQLAARLLDKKAPAIYNQAIMDFGATVCRPSSPLCNSCVFQSHCVAFNSGMISHLPVKSKKKAIRQRWFHYFILRSGNHIALRQRMEKDIWKGLYEFHLVETGSGQLSAAKIKELIANSGVDQKNLQNLTVSQLYHQQLTHQRISGHFILLETEKKSLNNGLTWVKTADLKHYAFPKFINNYLADTDMI